MSKQKSKNTNHTTPELIELLTDVARFTQKWKTPRIAKTIGMTKQGLQYHIDKEESR